MGGPVRSLVKHIYWERILPLLPHETGHGEYHEVESDDTFLMHRGVVMDVSNSQGLNSIVEMSVELVEYILNKRPALQMTEEDLQSVLVVLRLLSDNMEYVWDGVEMRKTREIRSRGGIGSVVGFSTHRPCFHCVSAQPLDSELALRLVELCGRIKSDTNTLQILQNMSQQLYGTTSFVSANVLPEQQAYLKQRNGSDGATKVDLTVDYIFRYISSANPTEYTRYLRHTVLKPFLEGHVSVEQGVLHYMDLFGCFYLNKRNLAMFLEMIRNMSVGMRKTVFHCLLLFYASRALMFWIMGRPEEYTYVFRLLRHCAGSGGGDSGGSGSSSSNSGNSGGSGTFVPGTSSVSDVVRTLSGSSLVTEEDIGRPILQLASALFEETYATFSVSSLLTSLASYGGGPSIGGSIGGDKNNDGNSSSSTPHSASSAMSFFSQAPLSSGANGSHNSLGELPLDEPTSGLPSDPVTHKWSSDGRPLQPEVPHVRNVLELYTTPDGSESLSHTSVLRFLMALLMLDPDVFYEINGTSFKNLPDVKGCIVSPVRAESEEKERIQGSIKHLTHGLKKLTTLPLSKKKSIKLITTLLKNITGSVVVADQAIMDTIKSVVTLFTMASSVSLVDSTIPSVVFCKRLFPIMACNLDLGKNWEKEAKLNTNLLKCLSRHPMAYGRLQIEFFAASTRLEQNAFLSRLHLNDVGSSSNLKKLTLYTEGFRIFFHLPSTKELQEGTALKTAELLKTLFYWVPDVILKSLPYFDGRITTVVSSIVDGSILDEISGHRTLFKDISHSSSSSIASLPNSQTVTLGSPNSGSALEVYSSGGAASQGVVRTISNNSSSSYSSSLNIPLNQNDIHIGHLIAPKARRVSGNSSSTKKSSVLVSSDGLETERAPYNVRTQVSAPGGGGDGYNTAASYTSSAVSNITRNIRSPLRHTRQRRLSDDTGVRPSRSNIATATENTAITSASREHDARRIMINIFSIFKRITDYIVVPHIENVDPEWPEKDFKSIIKSIFSSIIDTDASLQKTAQSFMDVLISYMSEFSENISPGTTCGYYKLCSYTVTLFSIALLDSQLGNRRREILLDIVVKFLKVRGRLEKNVERKGPDWKSFLELESSTFPIIMGTVGRGLFVSLYSNKNSVQKLLKIAYKEFYLMILFHKKISRSTDPAWADNLGFAKAMSEDNYVASGSVAFQRRLRSNILKFIKYPDAILFDVMGFIYKRWSSLLDVKSMSQEESSDFRSFGGIIASVCGVLLVVDAEKYPELSEMRAEVARHMNLFITKQCESLNNPDLLTRENARDILSTELHPLAFKLLFNNLKAKLEQLKGVDMVAPAHELSFVLLEQIIIILRTILKREDDEKILLLFSVEVVNSIDDIVEILEKMPNDSPKFFKAVIHMSKMFRAMESAEENLCIVGHYYLKNRWLKQVTFWFKLTIDKDYDIENISKPHREMDLRRRDIDILLIDTAIESSKALAYLTKNVPLEVPPSVSEEELKRSKFVIFGNYFNILLKGLERSTDLDSFPPSLKHKISILNENVITSLTNLSNANVDAGLQYSLPMGFSKNKNIKIAFLKVFINIVENYSHSADELAKLKMEAQNELLFYCIKNPYMAVIATVTCPANEIDSLAAGMVNAFDARNATIVLVVELIKEEIRTAPRYMDILRRNSCATRALSLFARSRGNEYLVKILRPILTELIDTQESFEVEKLNPKNPDADVQIALFVKYMKLIIDGITNSVDIFPAELIVVCKAIYSAVEEKFPLYVYVAVGSFVFLRFFCPALVSPESESIVEISEAPYKRPFITLAKVIQSLANGSDSVVKWPALESQVAFLEQCRDRIFHFLRDICETKHETNITINMDPATVNFDFNFLHRYLYLYDLDIRKATLEKLNSFTEFPRIREEFLLFDEKLAILGQPKEQFRNEIPKYIRDNKEECPQLYEFMSRHAFKSAAIFNTNSTCVHESMSPDGLPIITLTFSAFKALKIEVETIVYRTFRIYARIWSVKHYLVLDCTEFDKNEVDVQRLTSLFSNLLPSIALRNCQAYYYFNITESFISEWSKLFTKVNPYVAYKVPHYFVNSHSNTDFVTSLGLSATSMEVVNDVRVSLHDIVLYDERKKRFAPISLKIGNKYFQVLHETVKQYKIEGWDHLVDLKFNDVYQINHVSSVGVSTNTGVASEFTVNLERGKMLIFSSSKYLEIIKMFYYALARIEDEYGVVSLDSNAESGHKDSNNNECEQRLKTVCHLLLIVMVGLFNEDDVVKNVSYNLLAATQDAFQLDFGTRFHSSPEIHVPSDCSTFLCLISKSISKSSPDLTRYVFEYFLNGLMNQIIPSDYIPEVIICLSYWVPNLYKHVYLVDEEEGPEVMAQIIRALIRLTVSELSFTAIYQQQIWFYLALEGRLTFLIVEEVLNHALDRDSENRDWKKLLCLLNSLPTVEVTSQIILRLMNVIKSFLPSFKLETSTQSWSELTILVKTTVPLFFESPLVTQMFVPEALFITSLLIDVGPNEIRSSLYELLMNVCHSLTINDALPEANKQKLDEVCSNFSRQRFRFMFGFTQRKGSILQSFSTSSFANKFAALEQFATNILHLMEYSSLSESPQWKTRYKKYLIDAVFNSESFLSARAMMILGIIGKSNTSTTLCKNFLDETLKLVADPHLTDEQLFLLIAHVFTYSKVVEGLDPSSELMKQLFWLSSVFVESHNPVFFEGGLFFMANCLNRLYEYHFENDGNKQSLASILMGARYFAEPHLLELEGYNDGIWTEKNFAHNIIVIISRGCFVPSVKGTALKFLQFQFNNSFREHKSHPESIHYLCYLFFLYLLTSPENFRLIIQEAGFSDDLVALDNNNLLPERLLHWLSSNDCCPNITLYQGAVLFNSTVSDEPCKMRFGLVMRYLMKARPVCVFHFYMQTRQELRRISAFEKTSDCVPIAFDILRLIIKHPEVNELEKFNERSLAAMKERGLGFVTRIDVFDLAGSNALDILEKHSDLVYRRKKATTIILSRMSCFD